MILLWIQLLFGTTLCLFSTQIKADRTYENESLKKVGAKYVDTRYFNVDYHNDYSNPTHNKIDFDIDMHTRNKEKKFKVKTGLDYSRNNYNKNTEFKYISRQNVYSNLTIVKPDAETVNVDIKDGVRPKDLRSLYRVRSRNNYHADYGVSLESVKRSEHKNKLKHIPVRTPLLRPLRPDIKNTTPRPRKTKTSGRLKGNKGKHRRTRPRLRTTKKTRRTTRRRKTKRTTTRRRQTKTTTTRRRQTETTTTRRRQTETTTTQRRQTETTTTQMRQTTTKTERPRGSSETGATYDINPNIDVGFVIPIIIPINPGTDSESEPDLEPEPESEQEESETSEILNLNRTLK